MTKHINDNLNALNLPSDDDREFGRVEPWPEPVSLAELLDAVVSVLEARVFCKLCMLQRDALWIVASWLSDHLALDAFPLLLITAPDKGCGKTVYLELVGELVRKPVFGGNITGAALFRVIDERKGPTVLIDEWDSLGEQAKAMMTNLVNNGYRRKSAWTYRVASKDGAASKGLDRYRIWGPKVICGIGRPAATIVSRAHITKLERKPSNHTLEPVGASYRGRVGVLNRKLARVVTDYHDGFGEAVEQARRTDLVGNRGGDNWLPLRAVGILAGQRWTEIADKLAVMFSSQIDEDPSVGGELLRDIGIALTETGKTQITSAALIQALSGDSEKRWANYNGYGRAITDRQIAKLLRPYGVRSKAVTPGDRRRGYRLEDLQPAIEAYAARGDEPEPDLLGPLLADMDAMDEPQMEIEREPIVGRSNLSPDDVDDEELSPA
ncbi:DUF3631 domain-containing protein [Paraburkholderia fungorum]|uniref:DUF3631 domain-containing protein n=1 Tax=Paraburkholderia fungorum TaxID=134537 RepID=UPI003877D543